MEEIRGRKLYVAMSKSFSATIEAFNRAGKLGEHSQTEKSFLNSVRQAKDFAESSIDKMESSDEAP